MPEKLKPVSPAIQLAQKLRDLANQRAAGGVPEIPTYAGPKPTIYNVNTGEWDEVTPMQGRLLNVPLGMPVDPGIMNRMWRGGTIPYSPYSSTRQGGMTT